jgi:hypothetical protein
MAAFVLLDTKPRKTPLLSITSFGFALHSRRWKDRLHVLLQSVGRLVREVVSRQSGGPKFSLCGTNERKRPVSLPNA